MKVFITTLALALASLSAQAAVEIYKIDNSHSSVKFSVRHFVSKTTGSFNQFEGTITVDRDNLANSSVKAAIQILSVDTANAKRDTHLNKEDFFDSAAHPLMVFESTKWAATDKENVFTVTGNLQMHGISKQVVLNVELLGFGEGMRGAYLSGWEATTTLNRSDWGVSGGKPAVGDDITVTINIEAVRQ
jgi:polyisoprenoid-binding protein YceI